MGSYKTRDKDAIIAQLEEEVGELRAQLAVFRGGPNKDATIAGLEKAVADKKAECSALRGRIYPSTGVKKVCGYCEYFNRAHDFKWGRCGYDERIRDHMQDDDTCGRWVLDSELVDAD